MDGLKRSNPRKAVTYIVPASANRDEVLRKINDLFRFVQFSAGSNSDTIIVSLTGSHIYDYKVQSVLAEFGAEIRPY